MIVNLLWFIFLAILTYIVVFVGKINTWTYW
nr:MAG TPA: hypothetical protein [Caudoviricetes sp.]DAX63085.1 MAG TPA: hypothetical protein [Caudoviricetes sp.]